MTVRRNIRWPALISVLAVVPIGGFLACGGSGDEASGALPTTTSATGAAREGSWSLRTPSGATVRVRPVATPLRAGTTPLEIAIQPVPATDAPVSLDLASPTMPLHGVMRFPAQRTAAGTYLVRLEVPMEGRWTLYVNVSSDAHTASVEFDAAPAVAGSMPATGAHRHTSAGSPDS